MNRAITPEAGIELNDINDNNNLNEKFIRKKPGETPFNSSDIDTAPVAGELEIKNKPFKSFINKNKTRIITILVFLILCLFYLIVRKISKDKKITVIGLYFGSINSGYYIIKDSNKSLTSLNIDYSDLILDEYGLKGLEYGNKTLSHKKEDLPKEKRLYFSNFKKYLIHNESIDKILINADYPKNKNVTLIRVIKEYLDLLKDNIKENKNLKTQDIKWVITVPDIWDNNNKQILQNIAYDIDINKIDIISETNAALLGILNNNNNEYSNKNKVYMIINIDLFNMDINVNKVIDNNNNLKQLTHSINYPYGTHLINEKILDIIEYIYEKKDINDAIKQYDIWKITLDDIENKIKIIDDNMDGYLEIKADFNKNYLKYIVPNIPLVKEFVNYGTDKYQGYEIRHAKGKIMIPYKLIYKIINDNVLNIVEKNIENIINNLKEKIDSIIVMGEFCKSKILKNLIKNKFNNYDILFLEEYEKTIMKGASLYGLR